jgi:hypothetical protein
VIELGKGPALANLINIHHIGQGKYEVAYRGTIGHQGLAMLVVGTGVVK